MIVQKEGSTLDPEDENVVSIEFKSPIGAHAQIEPNGAVAFVKDGKATIKLSTQVINHGACRRPVGGGGEKSKRVSV